QQQQKAHMPLVTILRAKDGIITNYSVNPAPWHVELPPLPVDPPPKVAETKPAAPLVKTPPMAPPLILSGKMPESATQKAADSSRSNAEPIAKSPPVVTPSVSRPQSVAPPTTTSLPPEPSVSKLPAVTPSAGYIITEPSDPPVQHAEPTKPEHLPTGTT